MVVGWGVNGAVEYRGAGWVNGGMGGWVGVWTEECILDFQRYDVMHLKISVSGFASHTSSRLILHRAH